MPFETSNASTPRLPLYPLRWRAVGAARRQPRAAGQCSGRSEFSRLARRPAGANGGRQSARPAAIATGRHRHPDRSGADVYQEILNGAAMGVAACLTLVVLTGASYFGVAAAVMWGSCVGALIGILLCVGSAEAPECPVLPPSPEQTRGEKPDKPYRRR